MANFNKPDLDSLKSAFPGEVRDIATAAAKLDYSADTNVPDGVIKYNRSTDRLQEKTAGSFVDAPISNIKNPLAENIRFDIGYTAGTPSASMAATGTTQGGAASMGGYAIVHVTSATAGTQLGVLLPSPVQYDQCRVLNRSGITINIYPASGHQINSLGANNPVELANGESADFYAHTTSQWYCQQAGGKCYLGSFTLNTDGSSGDVQGTYFNATNGGISMICPHIMQITSLGLFFHNSATLSAGNIDCKVLKNGSASGSLVNIGTGVSSKESRVTPVTYARGDTYSILFTKNSNPTTGRTLWVSVWGTIFG